MSLNNIFNDDLDKAWTFLSNADASFGLASSVPPVRPFTPVQLRVALISKSVFIGNNAAYRICQAVPRRSNIAKSLTRASETIILSPGTDSLLADRAPGGTRAALRSISATYRVAQVFPK
jgi:hypothetical protein